MPARHFTHHQSGVEAPTFGEDPTRGIGPETAPNIRPPRSNQSWGRLTGLQVSSSGPILTQVDNGVRGRIGFRCRPHPLGVVVRSNKKSSAMPQMNLGGALEEVEDKIHSSIPHGEHQHAAGNSQSHLEECKIEGAAPPICVIVHAAYSSQTHGESRMSLKHLRN